MRPWIEREISLYSGYRRNLYAVFAGGLKSPLPDCFNRLFPQIGLDRIQQAGALDSAVCSDMDYQRDPAVDAPTSGAVAVFWIGKIDSFSLCNTWPFWLGGWPCAGFAGYGIYRVRILHHDRKGQCTRRNIFFWACRKNGIGIQRDRED